MKIYLRCLLFRVRGLANVNLNVTPITDDIDALASVFSRVMANVYQTVAHYVFAWAFYVRHFQASQRF
jgi:hypothetical protein